MNTHHFVGKGDGDLPSIPGVPAFVVADDYKATLPELEAKAEKAEAAALKAPPVVATPAVKPTVQAKDESLVSGVTVIGLALGLLVAPFLARKFKGMSPSEVVAYVLDNIRALIEWLVNQVSRLVKLVGSNKDKVLPEK